MHELCYICHHMIASGAFLIMINRLFVKICLVFLRWQVQIYISTNVFLGGSINISVIIANLCVLVVDGRVRPLNRAPIF